MKPSAEEQTVKTDRAISGVLRIGVNTSLAFIAGGTILSFLHGGGYGTLASDASRLEGSGGSFPRSVSWLMAGLAQLNGQAVIVAGLILLIATPVLRVAVSIVAFARERDRAFVVITSVVLALLLLSLALGKAG